jgi:hypothetical protein
MERGGVRYGRSEPVVRLSSVRTGRGDFGDTGICELRRSLFQRRSSSTILLSRYANFESTVPSPLYKAESFKKFSAVLELHMPHIWPSNSTRRFTQPRQILIPFNDSGLPLCLNPIPTIVWRIASYGTRSSLFGGQDLRRVWPL